MRLWEGLELIGCEVTIVLRDFKYVTGTIVGGHDERKHHEDKHEDNGDSGEFIVLELTHDANSVTLLEVERLIATAAAAPVDGAVEIEWANVEFEEGRRILINVENIIFIGSVAEFDEQRIIV